VAPESSGAFFSAVLPKKKRPGTVRAAHHPVLKVDLWPRQLRAYGYCPGLSPRFEFRQNLLGNFFQGFEHANALKRDRFDDSFVLFA